MKDFSKQAFSAYKENLAGLPSFCRLVMLEVFDYCDHQSGTISINSLEKLASDDFQVDPLRGRQKEVISGDKIRNAFRTIKKAKPDHFKFTTVNQRIVIDMPFLRELRQSIYGETPEVAAVLAVKVAEATTLAQSSESADFGTFSTGDVTGELAAASLNESINVHEHTSAKIKPNKTKPNNNCVSNELLDLKKPIADDFYPSPFLIDKALGMGLSRVTDLDEITKFIAFNKATGSQWKQFDYVFLTWLQRDEEREKAKQVAEQHLKPKYSFNSTNAGKSHHGTHNNGEKSKATQRVIAAYSQDGLKYCSSTNRFKERTNASGEIAASSAIKYMDIDSLGPVE